MIWSYSFFLLLQFVHHAFTIKTSPYVSDSKVSAEIPKPILRMDFESLDVSNIQPRKLRSWQTDKSKKPSMVEIALESAAREGINAMTDLYQYIEPTIVKNGQLLEDNHPAALLSKFSAPVEGTERSAMAAFATLSATKAFRRNYKESTVLGRQAQSQKVSFRRTPLEGLCPPRDPPTCMPASQRYRTHDGTCNNRRRLRWGSAQMPFNRFLPPEYGDGVDSIRGSAEGGPLSSARFVSLLVHGAREGEAPLTLMIVQWGQLLDHDLTSTAQPRSINGSVPSCCGSKDFHPSCFPIKVPLDDPWLAPLKVRCLEFLRSAPAQRRDCVLSWREQTNQVTSFIDASPIYSSNAKTSDNARIFRNGLLIYGRGDPADDVCMRGAIAHQCIRSGDGRSGEQPGLLALHHVWVGEHNRIAMELSILNPHWSDEKVYQETRRIIGALFQHITYREFLPIVLGREVCKLFDLELLKTGYYSGYDPNTNPSVSNAFAAAAFRFGHSLVQNTYMRCDRNHNFINNNVTLHEEFQQGDIGTAGSLHRLLRGLATQKALKRDEFITPELTNHLFQTPGFPFGLDLAAINIQRGRDHGIAPYTAWRQPCGLSAIESWDDLAIVVGPESAKRISHAYRNVNDIDLFVGGIAERPVIGGLVGPTFACIIAQQFSNSRKGDRFWYENSGFESSFTPAQLNSLRHVSLSSVLCRAINGGTLQPHVFIPNDIKGNQRIKCGKDSLEPIDLKPWLEQDPFLMSIEKIDMPTGQNPSLPSPISTLSTKEEKGINNRIQNVTMVANVDFIPNSSIGFHRVPNMTKIHDKLDMAHQKLVTRPVLKPIRGISNKLDKNRLTLKNNPKPTTSSSSKRISTTRRTVVIHNVEIELRNAAGARKEQKKKKSNLSQNSLASTAKNTISKVAGVVRSQISAAMGFLSDNDDHTTNHSSRKMNEQISTSNITNLTSNEFFDLNNKTVFVTIKPTNTTNYYNRTTEHETHSNSEPYNKASMVPDITDTSDEQATIPTAEYIKGTLQSTNSTDINMTAHNKTLGRNIYVNATTLHETYDKIKLSIDTSTEEFTQTSNNKYNETSLTKLTNLIENTTKELSKIDVDTENQNLAESKNLTLHPCTVIKENDDDLHITNNSTIIDKALNIFKTDTTPKQSTSSFTDKLTAHILKEKHSNRYYPNKNERTIHYKSDSISVNPDLEANLKTDNHMTDFHLKETHEAYKDFQAIIDSALQDPLDQHKRVHRKTGHTNFQVTKLKPHSTSDFTENFQTLYIEKTKLGRQILTNSSTFNETHDKIATRNDFPSKKLNLTSNNKHNETLPTKLTDCSENETILTNLTYCNENKTKELYKINLDTRKLKDSKNLKLSPDTVKDKNDDEILTTENITTIDKNLDAVKTDTTLSTNASISAALNVATSTFTDKSSAQILKKKLSNQYVSDDKNDNTDTIPYKVDPYSETPNLNSDKHMTDPSVHLIEAHKSYKENIDSALLDSLDQTNRVHRKTDHTNFQVEKVEFHTNSDFTDKLRTLQIDNSNEFTEKEFTAYDKTADIELDQQFDKTFPTETDDLTFPITTEQPETLRYIEHRQFQERPIYNRPQKLVLDAPDSDQYEIEINIRQTNTKPPKNNANYEAFNSPHKRHDTDRYNQHYDYPDVHNTPSNNPYTQTTRLPYGTRTKPPTIIYIDEHDDHHTTRGPGFLQNIISIATNGLNGFKQPTTSSTLSPFNQNPNRISNSGQTSDNYLSSHPSRPYQHSKPTSGNYLSAQQAQSYPPSQGLPQPGFSQGSSNFNPSNGPVQGFPPPNIYPPHALPGSNSFSTASSIGGVSHASSSAVSTGNFGSIAGSAASSGGDSTFSFNIRPSSRPQLNLGSPSGIKPDYEILPQRRPQYSSTPSYAVPPKPMPSVESFQYPPNKHDPFSSYTRRPPPYYNKIPNNVFDPAYDDIGRSELKIDEGYDDNNQKTNQTKNDDGFDDYDYNDDDDVNSVNIFNNKNIVEDQKSNSNDIDYLQRTDQDLKIRTELNETEFDDNFVLPALRQNDKYIEPMDEDVIVENITPYPTIEQKSLHHDILAEDYNELLEERSSFLGSHGLAFTGSRDKEKKHKVNEPVAFAPIQLLTKPERPDNWVIFETIDEKPLLPSQPDYNTETLVAAELPMPFQKRITPRISNYTTKTTDMFFSTVETTNLDTTAILTTEQSLEDLETDTYKPVTSQDFLKIELTTEINDFKTTINETEGFKLEEQSKDLFNFETEASHENTDMKQTFDFTGQKLTKNPTTDILTESITNLPTLT